MGIEDDDIARVRQSSDIIAVISEHVALKRVGRRWQGLCPFHAEKSASFSVNQEEGLYYCFGCAAKGDVITFVREIEHLDFVGAVEKLAGRAGITLRYTDHDQGESRKKRTRLVEALERAVDWYHERLLSSPDAATARGYLRSRGLDGDDVRSYRIGWAPEGWDELARALRLPDDVFVGAGLGFVNRRGRQTDSFRGRILFPIFDAQGAAVGFGGRIMPGGEGPKYKNSAESSVYAKSKVLYGLNWVKADIVTADEAIVCEGYTDVIGFAKAGVARAVATCGTALTDDHVRLLRSFARRVVLAFDADAAGQNAAERFYEWERTHDIDVAVASLPAGVDPGELAISDPGALRAAVDKAVPFLGFRVNRVLQAGDLRSPEGRARTAETALAVIAEHPSELVRDQYVMEVASRCQLDPDRLRSGLTGAKGRRPGRVMTVDRPVRAPERQESPEIELLRLLISRPEEMSAWDEWLHEVLFRDDLTLAAFRALRRSNSVHDSFELADPGAADLLQRLAVEDTEAEPEDVVLLLVRQAGLRAMHELDARASLERERFEYLAESNRLGRLVHDMNDEHGRVEAGGQLLAWLSDRSEDSG
jgi:DNA primase